MEARLLCAPTAAVEVQQRPVQWAARQGYRLVYATYYLQLQHYHLTHRVGRRKPAAETLRSNIDCPSWATMTCFARTARRYKYRKVTERRQPQKN